METADVLVVGLGAMGAATAYQLTKTGASVIGIDRYAPPHTLGSSHGDSRITRRATHEGPEFAPTAIRSHELWRDIEGQTGASILNECGMLTMRLSAEEITRDGSPDRFVITLSIAEQFGVDHEVLSGTEVMSRYPQFVVPDDYRAYFEPKGGYVIPEAAVGAQLALAEQGHATLKRNETVHTIKPQSGSVLVTTDIGQYSAGRVIVTAGPWVTDLLDDPSLKNLFTTYRQVMTWFAVDPPAVDSFKPVNCPVFICSFGNGADKFMYGFPTENSVNDGIKIAGESEGKADPSNVRREVSADETDDMFRRLVRGRIPALRPDVVKAAVCLYTLTPDRSFVIDEHPEHSRITIVSPCSGHGFKHSAAIGEAVAQRSATGISTLDLSPFSLSRFF